MIKIINACYVPRDNDHIGHLTFKDAKEEFDRRAMPDAERKQIMRWATEFPSDTMKAIALRNAIDRLDLAETGLSNLPMIPFKDIMQFEGLIAIDDPFRHRPIEGVPRFAGPARLTPSDDFVRSVHDLVNPDPHLSPFPFGKEGKEGLVLCGGACVNEMLIPENLRRVTKRRFVVEGDKDDAEIAIETRLYSLKKTGDHDFFVQVPSVADPNRRRDRARKIILAAIPSINPTRFSGNADDLCDLCHTCITPGVYSGCGYTHTHTHRFHVDCLTEHPNVKRYIEEHPRTSRHGCPCPVSGCTESTFYGSANTNEVVRISATRSTVNIQETSLTRDVKPDTRIQITGRVYRVNPTKGFDIPVCEISYDGDEMYVSEFGAACIANGILPVTPFIMSNSCEFRIMKYLERLGMDLYVPGLDAKGYADIKPTPVRGIAGIKWIVEHRASNNETLENSFKEFNKAVKQSRKALMTLMDALNVESPSWAPVSYAQPYISGGWSGFGCESIVDYNMNSNREDEDRADALAVADALAGKGIGYGKLKKYLMSKINNLPTWLRRRIAVDDGRNVNMQSLDMIHALYMDVLTPGAQVFFQAQFDYGRSSKAAPTGNAIAFYDRLWTLGGSVKLSF